jgi:WD40 repeat protein
LTEKGELLLLKVHTARFMVTPECAVFVKSSGATSTEKHGNGTTAATATDTSDIVSTTLSPNSKVDSGSQRDVKMDLEGGGEGEREWELVIALRDTPHLTYLNARTFEQRFISLNEADWDTHCSFTPLHLAVSPNLKYLLVATDKNFHFITAIGASKRLRILAGGHTCGDFGKPKASFDSTGKYVYCNNEDGSGVCVYSISTEKPVRFLTAHHGLVRDVVCHPSLPLLVTGSHDKSVILWTATKL